MSKFNSIFQKTFSNISEAAPTPGTSSSSNSALPSISSLIAAKKADPIWIKNFLSGLNATISNPTPGQIPTNLSDAEKKALMDLDTHYTSGSATTTAPATTTPATSNAPVV